MDIRHFRMIQEVARHGNLTKAAECLFLSQSALSHQLKDVETFFEAQMFIRQKKKMLLTSAGQVIVDAADAVLTELANAKNKVKCLTHKNAGVVRISTECFTSYHWLSSFISEFKMHFPMVEIEIDAAATNNASKALLENGIDVAIVENNLNQKFNYTQLFRDEFVVIITKGHPWERKKWIEAEDFFEENYIMYNVPIEISTVYQMLFKTGRPKKVTKIALTEAIVQMVKAGLGVSILPHWIVAPYLEAGNVSALRLTSKGIKRTWFAATLKNKEIPIFMNAFIRNLSKHLKRSEELSMLEFG